MEHSAGDPQLSPADALEQQVAGILSPPGKDSPGASHTQHRRRETVFNKAAVVFEDDSDDGRGACAEGVSRYGTRRRTQTQRLDDELAAAAAAQRAERARRAVVRHKMRGNSSDDDGDEEEEEEDEDGDWSGSSDDEEFGGRSRGRGRGRPRKRASAAAAEEEETPPRYTFTRKTRCVSYAEDSDSDEFLDAEERAMVRAERRAAAAEEERGDVIERVVAHRAVGGAPLPEDAEAEIDWERGVEYCVQWRGRALIHSTWAPLAALRASPGWRRAERYAQRVQAERAWRRTAAPEDVEQADIQRELAERVLAAAREVERVVAHRRVAPPTPAFPHGVAYLVKWRGQPYAACTWEDPADIAAFQNEIDAFFAREQDFQFTTSRTTAVASSNMTSGTNSSKGNKNAFVELKGQPEGLKGGRLRDYQVDSVNLMTRWYTEGINGILADEMGLGKTVQTVALLHHLRQSYGVRGPHLVVVPLSTVGNWAGEFRAWSPQTNVVVYGGDAASRRVAREHEFYGRGRRVRFHVLLTTREVVLKDRALLAGIGWRYLVVDEAQCLKNPDAQLYQALLDLRTTNKLLVTGTPLQNNIGELWALVHFLMPQRFASLAAFEARYADLQQHAQIAQLHAELKPYLLRRVKKDVERALPQKHEQILRVPPSPMQRQYCEWVVHKNFRALNRGAPGAPKSTLLNAVVELKKVLNHPYLFPGAEDPAEPDVLAALVRHSGKMRLLDKLLARLRETGHRVLIFSQMVRMLDILSDYLRMKAWPFQRLDGSTPRELRQTAMDHFNAPASPDFVFLLSTHAGGLGINLASADTVVIYDSDWNPQNDLQAMARCHRIGQNKTVNIYRLVTSNSVEETIVERAKQKMVLDHLVIQSMDTTAAAASSSLQDPCTNGSDGDGANATSWLVSGMGNSSSEYSKEELQAIIRFRAEALFKKDDDAAEDLDIDAILARAENVDTSATTSAAEELLNAFNVTSIAATSDEEYWSRVLPEDAAAHAAEIEATTRARTEAEKTKETLAANESRKRHVPSSSSLASGTKMKRGAWEEKEIRSFVRGFRMFPDLARIENIVSSSPHVLGQRKPAKLVALGEELLEACREFCSNQDKDKKEEKEEKEEKDEKEKKEGLVFRGVPVDAEDVLHRVECARLLAEKVREYGDVAQTFRLVDVLKPPAWPIPWGPKDDSMLLLGVYRHGIGNWEAITSDEELGLDAVREKKLKSAQLMRRVEALFRTFTENPNPADKKNHAPAQKRPPPSESKEEELKKERVPPSSSSSSGQPSTKKPRKNSEESSGTTTTATTHHSSSSSKESNNKESNEFVPPAKVDPVYGAWNMFAPVSEEMWSGSERAAVREVLRRRRGEVDDIMEPVKNELHKMAYFRKHELDKSVEFVVKKSLKYLCTVGDHIGRVLASYAFHNVELEQCLWAHTARFTKCCGPALHRMYNRLCDGDCPPDLAHHH